MTTATRATAATLPSPWIASPRWDLTWLLASALLVPLPVLANRALPQAFHIDLLVTVLVGGPHMYATFLRTAFDAGFRERHPALTWGPVIAIPAFVIAMGSQRATFPWLLSLFFTWASLHICDQASYIAQLYRERAGAAPSRFDRGLDFLTVAASLYVFAIFRFVDGSFTIEGYGIFFPDFLKVPWVPRAFAAGTAALVAFWAVRTLNQWKARLVSGQYVGFMVLTMAISVMVPSYLFKNELAVTFQGFNAWHSFQYLGLTFLALNRSEKAGAVTLGFLQQLAAPRRFFKYYGWNVLLTFGSGVIVFVLTRTAGIPAQQCYYIVVLSTLLVHYFHDSVLFNASREMKLAEA